MSLSPCNPRDGSYDIISMITILGQICREVIFKSNVIGGVP
ncbi:hypothetical protein ASZ90_012436 [hydrocarbon metagenome]|uniref:Uncharacterized protein n=1 Tax=hydrocarbon metagenome TaxID=938273 RepID=A0A0W8FAK3_9ZZZZ